MSLFEFFSVLVNRIIFVFNPHWHELWKQEKCHLGAFFTKLNKAWHGIKLTWLLSIFNHLQKSLGIFYQNSAVKLWSNKDKEIKVSHSCQLGLRGSSLSVQGVDCRKYYLNIRLKEHCTHLLHLKMWSDVRIAKTVQRCDLDLQLWYFYTLLLSNRASEKCLTLIEACYLSLKCDRKEKYNPVSYAIMILAPGNCLTFRRACKNMRFDVGTSVDFFPDFFRNVWTRQIEGYDTTQTRQKVFKFSGGWWVEQEGHLKENVLLLSCQKT